MIGTKFFLLLIFIFITSTITSQIYSLNDVQYLGRYLDFGDGKYYVDGPSGSKKPISFFSQQFEITITLDANVWIGSSGPNASNNYDEEFTEAIAEWNDVSNLLHLNAEKSNTSEGSQIINHENNGPQYAMPKNLIGFEDEMQTYLGMSAFDLFQRNLYYHVFSHAWYRYTKEEEPCCFGLLSI